MTVAEALELIRRVGVVASSGGNLKLKLPERERAALQPAIDTLRGGKAEALALLTEPLKEQGGVSWAEWKAAALNRLFRQLGVTGQPGRILAATVTHGARAREIK